MARDRPPFAAGLLRLPEGVTPPQFAALSFAKRLCAARTQSLSKRFPSRRLRIALEDSAKKRLRELEKTYSEVATTVAAGKKLRPHNVEAPPSRAPPRAVDPSLQSPITQ